MPVSSSNPAEYAGETGHKAIARFHLPGLFEFYELYKAFLKLYFEHGEYFYNWCDIGSIYGSPGDCLWGGGSVGYGDARPEEVLALMQSYGISSRLTFSNSLLSPQDLADKKCNKLCQLFNDGSKSEKNGVIVHSDILVDYLQKNYPNLYLVSSTTKVLTNYADFNSELERREFSCVVPDFRLNKSFEKLSSLPVAFKNKVEFLCNECCWIGCKDRKACYETVSRKSLGEEVEHVCKAPDSAYGYRFSKAMKNPSFISIEDIQKTYLPMGFSNFKIEGRSLGSALILEFLLYYMTKPEFQLNVREEIYLDNSLDLF